MNEEKKYLSSAVFDTKAKIQISASSGISINLIANVWHCKTLQHHKGLYMVQGSKRYYEVTYNGDNGEMYIDTYVKEKNEVVNV